MALHWFKDAFNPSFEEFQRWVRESPDGDSEDLFDDSAGGCQDFDLMVDLTTGEFEELLLDTTDAIHPEARRSIADLLVRRVKSGDLAVSPKELKGWASGASRGGTEVAGEGVELLRTIGEDLLSEAKRRGHGAAS